MTDQTACVHDPREDDCTVVVMADGCSLQCSACKEVLLALEPMAIVIDSGQVTWR